ncbi:MAG TPA: glutathione S-transferase N-terminal domain-containing protein [Rhodospirillales bacterium]|nr:glutathione S-transferase N-terminal domain-containing protein [Rhodospirillales bacterium]
MKLRYSPTSPYVRKVTVTAHECGLHHRIERLPTDIREPQKDFLGDNPLGKVPALITDDGLQLFDSRVICEYLDSLHDGRKLFPVDVPARWRTLRLMALADGITDAAVLRRLETLRPDKERSAFWIERQRGKEMRGLDMLEREVPRFNPHVTIGQISVGCSLGWLDFRWGTPEDWRIGRPLLADWYSMFMSRPSMTATVPEEQ